MRCPKCGCFTFDHLEVCTKCNKNIAKVSEKLSGTIYHAEAPAFLQFEINEPDVDEGGGDDAFDNEDDFETEEFADEGGEIEMSFDDDDGDGEEIEFGDEGENENEDEDEDIEFNLSSDDDDLDLNLSDDDEEQEFDLGSSEKDDDALADLDLDDGGGDAPSIDFGNLDISDLAPPIDTDKIQVMDGVTAIPGAGAGDIPEEPAMLEVNADPTELGGMLADLEVDGLDLEIPSAAPAGSATGEKIKPAAKTGTALDNFDFDLGDLMSGGKK